MTDEMIMNVANSLGLSVSDREALLQFSSEMQAHALLEFAGMCRLGDPHERIYWADAAMHAEWAARDTGAFTI